MRLKKNDWWVGWLVGCVWMHAVFTVEVLFVLLVKILTPESHVL